MGSSLSAFPRPLGQIGALPVRLHDEGWVEVCLITSLETGRWIIPKGWRTAGLAPHLDAAKEAFEEAGLLGAADPEPFGEFVYDKRMSGGFVLPCSVSVHLMYVEGQADSWPERAKRTWIWLSSREASRRVCNPSLQRLIAKAGRSPEAIRRAIGGAAPAPRRAARPAYLAR